VFKAKLAPPDRGPRRERKSSAIPHSLLAIDGLFAGKLFISKLEIMESFNRFRDAEAFVEAPRRV
jgi:hypothetical protein